MGRLYVYLPIMNGGFLWVENVGKYRYCKYHGCYGIVSTCSTENSKCSDKCSLCLTMTIDSLNHTKLLEHWIKKLYEIVNVLSIPDKHASCDGPCPNSRDSTTTRYNHLAGLVHHFPESKNRSFKNALRSGASGGLSSTSGPMIAPLEAGCLGPHYLWWTGEAAGKFDIIDCISQTWKISKMSGVRRCDIVNVWIHNLSKYYGICGCFPAKKKVVDPCM